MTYRSVSLKVCEGCGTLWVRQGADAGVYCGPCALRLQEFPDPKTRLRPGRPVKRRADSRREDRAENLAENLAMDRTENQADDRAGRWAEEAADWAAHGGSLEMDEYLAGADGEFSECLGASLADVAGDACGGAA